MSPSGIGQARGTIGHATLGNWYSNMGKMSEEERDDTAMKLASKMFCDEEASRQVSLEKEWELMSVILPRYFEWARANDNFTEILAIEQKFELNIAGIPVIGFIDGVVKIKNSI